jgi:predicted MPP superfamily phosphohydrolase
MRFIAGWIIDFGIIELLLIILLIGNIFTFVLYWMDKDRAVKDKKRISESTLLFFTVVFGGIGALLGVCLVRHKTKNWKFRIAVVVGLIVMLISGIHIIHGLTMDRIIRYVDIEFHSENWPARLNGYRIAFITDMHTITDEAMREVAKELNNRNLDLLLLGGDFSMEHDHYRGTIREIVQIAPVDGIFGVDGNHDDYIRLFAAKEYYGITPLDNSGLQIRDGFYLSGTSDLWNRSPNISEAVSGALDDDFVMLVSHNPDVAIAQSTIGIDLILSGHTHAGHITFFGLPIVLLLGYITDYGIHFAHGFAYSADGVPVFTSSGLGFYYGIPRIFARPEVVIFTMYNSANTVLFSK